MRLITSPVSCPSTSSGSAASFDHPYGLDGEHQIDTKFRLYVTLFIFPSDKPTLPTLIKFKCCDGSHVNIAEEIGIHYMEFGYLLLQDETGAKVDSITHKHRENPNAINLEIFRLWLNGAGLQPVSWKTLVDVLKDIKLNVLVDKISTAKAF